MRTLRKSPPLASEVINVIGLFLIAVVAELALAPAILITLLWRGRTS